MKNISNENFQSLLKANQILSSTLNLDDLLRKIMELATDVVEAETSSILLYDKAAGELVFDLALTDKESKLKEVRIKVGEGIAGWVAKEKKEKIVNDMKNEPNAAAKRTDSKINFETRSVLAVPLIYKGSLLGVVEAINKKNGDFTQDDALVLSAFAAQAAVSIQNAELFENLREENEKIEAMFSQMSDGAIFYDENGKKILNNLSAEKLVGKENIKKGTIFEIFSDFDKDASLINALKAKDKFIQLEMKRSKGKTLYLSCVISRIYDIKNKMIGSILIFRDTTNEKKESMLKANFLSLVSHKLKTPLVSIIGYCPLLLAEKNVSEFQKKAIETINRQGVHLSNLVDKLLYFSLIEGDKLVLNKQKISFGNVIEKAESNMRPFLEANAVSLTISKNIKTMPKIEMDIDKMEVVIRNIIENAVKFNTRSEKNVIIEPRQEDDYTGISVKDNGAGIPPEERDKIFQKFYQIEEAFTGQVEGAGLGLALVKHIVEAHGGKAGVESIMDEGSEFYILLPK